MKIAYFTVVEEVWDAMYADCESAKKSIRFEQFILSDFRPGEIGEKFALLFEKKAQEGVRVRILLDVFGSYSLILSPYLLKLHQAGVEIKFTSWRGKNKPDMFDIQLRRDHRKLAIIDDTVVYLGGVVLMEEVRHWNDFHARIEANTKKFIKAFELMWGDYDAKDQYQLNGKVDSLPFVLLSNSHRNKMIYRAVCSKLRKAKEKIVIITPYFAPDRKLRRCLKGAAARGVPVTVLIPASTDSTIPYVVHVSFIRFAKKYNIQLMCAQQINHAKIIQIDQWVTFGSCNFDNLSFHHNKELNVVTEDPGMIQDVTEHAITPFLENTQNYPDYIEKKHSFIVRRGMHILGYILRPLA